MFPAPSDQQSMTSTAGRSGSADDGRRTLPLVARDVPEPAASGGIRSFLTQHPLSAFFVLVIGLPWFCAPLADGIFYSGLPTLLAIALALPFEILVASPLGVALILTAITGGKSAVADLLRGFLRWRVGWRWWAVALTLPPALAIAPAYLNMLGGAPAPSTALFGSASAILGVFVLRLVNPWDGPGSEELGWRGYALPRLQQRYSPLTASLILAGAVVTWHLRLVADGDLPPIALIGTLAATLLFGWLYNSTSGSLALVYLFHATDGVLKPDYTGSDATHYLWLQIAVWAVAATGVVLYSGRALGSTTAGLRPRHARPAVGASATSPTTSTRPVKVCPRRTLANIARVDRLLPPSGRLKEDPHAVGDDRPARRPPT